VSSRRNPRASIAFTAFPRVTKLSRYFVKNYDNLSGSTATSRPEIGGIQFANNIGGSWPGGLQMGMHKDLLSATDKNLPLEKKLRVIHKVAQTKHPFIDRISVALYEKRLDMLRTFLASSGRDYPLEFYEAQLSEAPSLKAILETGMPRVINDLSLLDKGEHEHTKSIIGQGYRSSYTIPMHFHDEFVGFVFFNSYEPDCMSEQVLNDLDVYAHLISSLINQELSHIYSMLSALKEKSAEFGRKETRYEQTLRLTRISRFARVIAVELAKSGKYDLRDSDVEEISWFSPFHLLSKVYNESPHCQDGSSAAFDSQSGVYMKPDPGWIDRALKDLGFESSEATERLKAIAFYYHENVDGSGYPRGLKKEQIPIEARIVCVADLFDAMTGQGVAMQAWSNDEAYHMLMRLTKNILDEDCVQALIKNRDKVEQIQASFIEVGAWVS
jgi:HD domain